MLKLPNSQSTRKRISMKEFGWVAFERISYATIRIFVRSNSNKDEIKYFTEG